MPSVLRELPLTYAVLSVARWCIPPRPPLTSSTARVRLHLKPGQKGTNQLLGENKLEIVGYCCSYGNLEVVRFHGIALTK